MTSDYFHLYFIVSMACINFSFLDGYRANRLNEKRPWADFVSSSFGRFSRFFSRLGLVLTFHVVRNISIASSRVRREKEFYTGKREKHIAGIGSMQEQRS